MLNLNLLAYCLYCNSTQMKLITEIYAQNTCPVALTCCNPRIELLSHWLQCALKKGTIKHSVPAGMHSEVDNKVCNWSPVFGLMNILKRVFFEIMPNFVITCNIVAFLRHITTLFLRHCIWGYLKLSITWQGLFFHFMYNPLHGLKFRTNFKLTQKTNSFFLSQFILPYLVCDLCALSSTLDWFWSKASKSCNHISY